MSTSRSIAVIGGILLALSGVLAGGFVLTTLLSEPDTGANIGGGLMMLAAAPLAIAGVVVLVVSALLSYLARRKAIRTP
ncbi:hypothetical protein BIV04_13675 [Frigoribacterium sp. MCBA15_019]|nr:hypothetical protein BIV04_13675 [Frigoribacterium sp. MCBA15_019]